MYKKRLNTLLERMAEADIEVALITDDDSVYYYTGYYDYLHHHQIQHNHFLPNS